MQLCSSLSFTIAGFAFVVHDHCLYAATVTRNVEMKVIFATFWFVVFLSTASVRVSGLGRASFSVSLQNAVTEMLGSDQYKVSKYKISK